MPRERRGSNKKRGEGEAKQSGNRNRPSPAPRTPTSPSQAKRQAVQCSPSLPELIPPLLSGPGESIVANNPFDDPRQHQLAPLQSQGGYPGPHRHPLGPPGPAGPYGMHPKHGPPMPPVSMPPGAGKVYPPNQPMVFNPSNPNAPPIYPCGICHKEVSQDMVHDNDQAILCESGCNFWFHRVCTGLTEPAYQMLTQEVYAEWVCDKCLQTKNIPLVKMKP